MAGGIARENKTSASRKLTSTLKSGIIEHKKTSQFARFSV
jgi:hypothetical protein